MTKKTPRVGYATRGAGSPIRLHAPSRVIPIVLVPGIMGTRLSDPKTGEHAWNPLGAPLGKSPGSFCVDFERLMNPAELVPTSDYEKSDETGFIHFYGLVVDFFDKLCEKLAAAEGFPCKTKVYCAGYDWRGDNARSAFRVSQVVDQALRETGEKQVVLIAHSLGGLVSRYYCRMLGGEPKVYRLILIASPTLGAPTAYQQIKSGVAGFYVKEALEGDSDAAVSEALLAASHLPRGVQQVTGAYHKAFTGIDPLRTKAGTAEPNAMGLLSGSGEALPALFGDIYIAASIGAGRMLTRKETLFFTRQLLGLYQLMPHPIFCREAKHWVVFDPFATGIPPTGHMLVLPTIFDGGIEAVKVLANALGGNHKRLGDSFKEKADAWRQNRSERTNKHAKRNITTLAERVEELEEAFSDFEDLVKLGEGVKGLIEIYERIDRCFVDCRNARQLYGDIYTGLMDVVELRGVSAANLEFSHRFFDALTVNHRVEEGKSPTDLVGDMVKNFINLVAPGESFVTRGLDWLAAGGSWLGQAGIVNPLLRWKKPTTPLGDDKKFKSVTERVAERREERAKEKAKEEREAAERKRKPPCIYMHPRTIAIYCDTQATIPGLMIVPKDFLSNDDSNIVTQQVMADVATWITLLTTAAGDGKVDTISERVVWGDDQVPVLSAIPDPEWMSNPFLKTHRVTGISHAPMPNADQAMDFIDGELSALALDFLSQ